MIIILQEVKVQSNLHYAKESSTMAYEGEYETVEDLEDEEDEEEEDEEEEEVAPTKRRTKKWKVSVC